MSICNTTLSFNCLNLLGRGALTGVTLVLRNKDLKRLQTSAASLLKTQILNLIRIKKRDFYITQQHCTARLLALTPTNYLFRVGLLQTNGLSVN